MQPNVRPEIFPSMNSVILNSLLTGSKEIGKFEFVAKTQSISLWGNPIAEFISSKRVLNTIELHADL